MARQAYIQFNARIPVEDYNKYIAPAEKAGYSDKEIVIEGARCIIETNYKPKVKAALKKD